MMHAVRSVRVCGYALVAAALVTATACGSSTASRANPATSAPASITAASPSGTSSSTASPSTSVVTPAPSLPSAANAAPGAASVPSATAPVIVIDPGHAPTITSTDPATGLNDSDYENEPEMQDVFAVALLVKAKLEADGYKVVLTKNSATDRVSLGQRAAIANNAHAALAISIHDQAGASGGIGFTQGNNIVYYQSVGNYRATPNGTHVTFADATVAAASAKYGAIFQTQRASVEGVKVQLLGNTGYDLGSRGLPAGNIWIVQLLAKVPWIYNESGGNSAGQSGLNASDKQKYADGLSAGVEASVPNR